MCIPTLRHGRTSNFLDVYIWSSLFVDLYIMFELLGVYLFFAKEYPVLKGVVDLLLPIPHSSLVFLKVPKP